MILALRSYEASSEDVFNVTVVELTAEKAALLLKRHGILLNLRKEDEQTDSIVWFDNDADFLDGESVIDALPSDKQEEFDDHALVEIDTLPEESEHDFMRVDSSRIIVGEYGVTYMAYAHHSGVQLTTVEVPLDLIKKIAGPAV